MRPWVSGAVLEKTGLVLLSGLLFSLTIAGVSVATRSIPPATLTVLRLATAAVVVSAALAVRKPGYRWHWRGVVDMVIIGLLNIGLPFLCLAFAIEYIASSLAAVLFNTIPVFTVLLAHFILPDEKLNGIKLAGTLVAVAGATLLLTSNASGLAATHPQGWIGQLLVIVASFVGALGVIYSRVRLRGESTFVLTAGQIFASLLILLPVALVAEGRPALNYPWQAWLATAVAALSGPVAGFWVIFYIMRRYSASLAGFAGIATPLFSVLIGVVFLNEVVTVTIAAGTALVLAGIWSLTYF